MAIKVLDTNRMRNTIKAAIGQESIWYEVPESILGIESASITSGNAEFSAVYGDSTTGGPPFVDLTVTLSQSGGDYGFCNLDVSGTHQAAFQITEVGGRPIGPFDLNSVAAADWLSICWKNTSTTFKINVKAGVSTGTYSAIVSVKDHNNETVLTINLSAEVQDAFVNQALSLSSAQLTDIWMPINNSGVIGTSDNTMVSIFGDHSGSFATATDATTGTGEPAFVSTGLSYFSISRGISNGESDSTSNRTLATPITASNFHGTNMSGSWFFIYQGEGVNSVLGSQAEIFYLGTDNNGRLRHSGPSGGNNRFRYLSDDTSTAVLDTAPATTISTCITRDGAGALSFYSQPANGTIATPETATSSNADDRFGLGTAQFKLVSASGIDTLKYTLVCVLIFSGELSSSDIQFLNNLIE